MYTPAYVLGHTFTSAYYHEIVDDREMSFSDAFQYQLPIRLVVAIFICLPTWLEMEKDLQFFFNRKINVQYQVQLEQVFNV